MGSLRSVRSEDQTALFISASIKLVEKDMGAYGSVRRTLVEAELSIQLPVPDTAAIAPYLSQQIAGFLDLAGAAPELILREATADEAEDLGQDPGMRDTGEPLLVSDND